MKKPIATLLAVLLALLSLTAFAEDAVPAVEIELPADDLAESVLISGFVLEATAEYVLIRTDDGMMIQANLTPDTAIEGSDVHVGDLIQIVYNGMMTRSLPAQIAAQIISNHQLTGVVSELTDESFLLTAGEMTWQINASAQQLASIQDGMTVTVYHSGMMTRSIPAQVAAQHIRGQQITGTVIEMTENGFTLMDSASDAIYTVIPMEDALSFVTAEPGMTLTIVTNGMMTPSLDPIVNAAELLPAPVAQELFDLSGAVTEITEEYILIQSADGQEYQVNLLPETNFEGKELSIGDFIHVTYNGQMTRSLPAQVAALTIGCYAHQGVVSDIVDGQFMLTTENDMILVNFPAEMADSVQDGATVIVYSNGAMTMSLPAQIGAELIVQLSR